MKQVIVKKEGYMFSASDESAELLHEILGYHLYSIANHIKTGFPIRGYNSVKRRLAERALELYVEDMSDEEIEAYIKNYGNTIEPKEESEILFVLNCLIEGTDPTNGLEIEHGSFVYDTMVQKVLVQIRDIIEKKTSKRKKQEKLGANEPTIQIGGVNIIVDENGEIKSDLILFNRLRDWRLAKSQQEQLPPYIIFYDKTLIAFATYYPQTKEDFLKMYGAGEFKWEKYGSEIVELITNHIDEVEGKENTPF